MLECVIQQYEVSNSDQQRARSGTREVSREYVQRMRELLCVANCDDKIRILAFFALCR